MCCYIINLINHGASSHIEFLNVTQDFLCIQKYVCSKENHEPILRQICTHLCCTGTRMVYPLKKILVPRVPTFRGLGDLLVIAKNVPNRFLGLQIIFWRHYNFQVDFKDVLGIFLRCSRHVNSVLTMEIDDSTI